MWSTLMSLPCLFRCLFRHAGCPRNCGFIGFPASQPAVLLCHGIFLNFTSPNRKLRNYGFVRIDKMLAMLYKSEYHCHPVIPCRIYLVFQAFTPLADFTQ